MGIQDKDKHTFNDQNESHNEEEVEGMFEGRSLTYLDLYQCVQAGLKNKMEFF